MAETALKYLLLVLFCAAFSVVYFTWLESSMDRILSKKSGPAHIHISFVARLIFAAAFFRVMLVYYPGVWDVAAMVAIFIAARYFMLRRGVRG